MLYKHKETGYFVDLISSGTNYCTIIALNKMGDKEENFAKVIKGNKTEFKKFFKKAKEEEAIKKGFILIPSIMREEIKERTEASMYSILYDSENLVQKSLEREHKQNNEELLKYADSVNLK